MTGDTEMKHAVMTKRHACLGFCALFVWAGCAALPAVAQGTSEPEGWERCYGVSTAGQNDGLASGPDELVPGSSQTDYQGTAWVLVPNGECVTIETPKGRGSLSPFDG